jgi:hypothetical protein
MLSIREFARVGTVRQHVIRTSQSIEQSCVQTLFKLCNKSRSFVVVVWMLMWRWGRDTGGAGQVAFRAGGMLYDSAGAT